MLETIREYAAERLQAEPEAGEIFERHTRFYTELAKSAHGELRGPSQGEWLERLDPELENLRTAIRWAQEHDDALEVELAGATWFFLSLRGLLHEALGYLRRAIETAENAPSLDRSELLYGGAYVALRTGDYAAAERWSEQRLALGRARGDAPVIARSLVGLARRSIAGRPERPRRFSSRPPRSLGTAATRGPGHGRGNLGGLAITDRRHETARGYFQQALELHRETVGRAWGGRVAWALGSARFLEGDIDEAAALLADSLRLASRMGDREGMFYACSTQPRSRRDAVKSFALRVCSAPPTRFGPRSDTARPTCPSRTNAPESPISSTRTTPLRSQPSRKDP